MSPIFTSTGRKISPFVAVLSISTLLFAGIASAQSKTTSFTDVSAGVWYESAARDLLDLGALDASQVRLRPNDLATRAEMIELLVRLRSQPLISPAARSFDDVSTSASYYKFMETAARAGWVHGDGDCYGTHPCTARPYAGVNRAEAATLLMRVFSLPSTNKAPVFTDNRNQSTWYYDTIQTSADHCVLQGDDATGLVRPASGMNRAEMIVMFDRASKNQTYGVDCGIIPQVQGDLSNAVAMTSMKIRLTFTTDLSAARATNASRYTVTAIGGGTVAVSDATQVNTNTVDLTLVSNLINQTSYRVTATDLTTTAGATFSGTRSFLFTDNQAVTFTVAALSATRVRVLFTADMGATTANDAIRYGVRESNNNNAVIGVYSVAIVDIRTVDLTLSSGLKTGVAYLLSANDVVTLNGVHFNASSTFTLSEPVATISNVSPINATVLRVTVTTDLDQATAERVTHYRVNGNGRDLAVTNAHFVSARLVDLTVGETMDSQRIYTVIATDLKTAGGVLFSDTASTLYSGTDVHFSATMIGAKEVPAVSVALSGTGTFTLTAAGLVYNLTLTNMTGSTVAASHFHRGALGVNGPVIQAITFTGNHATGTWTGLSEQDRNELIGGGIYVNVHTQAYPDGAIRGQVTKL